MSSQNAMEYLNMVKNSLSTSEYNVFLHIMASYKSCRIGQQETIDSVYQLFSTRQELIKGFQVFLPSDESIIDIPDTSASSASGNYLTRVQVILIKSC